MTRFQEFLQVNGEYSMRNLTVFITIVAATIVVLYLASATTNIGESRLNSEIFIAYLLAGGGVYSYGKMQDTKENIAQIKADSTPSSITVKNIENAENLTQEGDVRVEK